MSNRHNIIAVIDDDPAMRRALKRLLSAYEYETEFYASAQEFLDAAAKCKAACLIVDVQLGLISGIDLAWQLVESKLTLPLIFMTASDDGVLRTQAIKAGCIAYLRKPFTAELLIEALDKVFR